MRFLPTDPLNCEIIAHSLGLQRQIPVVRRPDGRVVGAQQAMAQPEHSHRFGPNNPLPWVPDCLGAVVLAWRGEPLLVCFEYMRTVWKGRRIDDGQHPINTTVRRRTV